MPLDNTMAPNDRNLQCLPALRKGIPLDLTAAGNAIAGECGCGHPIVARTWEAAHAALAAHFTERQAQ